MKFNKAGLKKVYDDLTRPIKKGQSLVEIAIVLPILLLMLLGVFEVGWALRGYLVLTNVNREADRFAARGIYLDFSNKNDPGTVGYEKIFSHSIDSLSSQLTPNFSALNNVTDPYATAMLVTYYTVQPLSTFGCPGDAKCVNFVCDRFADPTRADYVAGEALNDIEYPRLIPPPGFEANPDLPVYYQPAHRVLNLAHTSAITAYYYHNGGPFFSRISPITEVIKLRSANNALNCQRLKKNLPPTDDNIVIVEHFYNQPQITGLPFVTAFVPNPVLFYSHTAMRMNTNVRELEDEEANTCQLRPIVIPSSKVGQMTQGGVVTIPVANNPDVPGNFSYLHWDADSNQSDGDLANELIDPTTIENWNESSNPFTGVDDTDDTAPNISDWIQSKPGAHDSNAVKDALDLLKTNQEELLLPVWNDQNCPGTSCGAGGNGSNGAFQIYTFVVMKIIRVDYNGSPKQIIFQFSHFAPNSCVGDDRGG